MKTLKSLFYLLVISGGIYFLPGCGNNVPKAEAEKTEAEIESLKQEKRELTLKLEAEKKKIDEQIADLRKKKASATEKKAAEFYDESIERLNKTNDSLDARMVRFERETEKDWNQLKKEMDEAFDSAERELNEVGEAIEDFFRKDNKKD